MKSGSAKAERLVGAFRHALSALRRSLPGQDLKRGTARLLANGETAISALGSWDEQGLRSAAAPVPGERWCAEGLRALGGSFPRIPGRQEHPSSLIRCGGGSG